MLAAILIGGAELVAISLAAALLLFAHLTGRLRRATALVVAAGAGILGLGIAAGGALGGALGGPALEPMATPFGVFLALAAAINGLVAYQARKA